jgi:hypothetical protein
MTIVRHAVAVGLMIAAGLIHGVATCRWNPSGELAGIGNRFDSISMTIDGWRGTVLETSARELLIAGASAHLSRRYTHINTGDTVSVVMLAGNPGQIASHAPDVCYPGAGYILDASHLMNIHYGSEGRSASFRIATARRPGPEQPNLMICWAWYSTDGWTSPDEPRWAFLGEPMLVKLSIVHETSGSPIAPEDIPASRFLKLFLAEIDHRIFGPRA